MGSAPEPVPVPGNGSSREAREMHDLGRTHPFSCNISQGNEAITQFRVLCICILGTRVGNRILVTRVA